MNVLQKLEADISVLRQAGLMPTRITMSRATRRVLSKEVLADKGIVLKGDGAVVKRFGGVEIQAVASTDSPGQTDGMLLGEYVIALAV